VKNKTLKKRRRKRGTRTGKRENGRRGRSSQKNTPTQKDVGLKLYFLGGLEEKYLKNERVRSRDTKTLTATKKEGRYELSFSPEK